MILYHGSYIAIEQPNQQNCFRTKKALDCLSFLKGEIV